MAYEMSQRLIARHLIEIHCFHRRCDMIGDLGITRIVQEIISEWREKELEGALRDTREEHCLSTYVVTLKSSP